MEQCFRRNWNETRQRFTAWWRGEKLDRPLLAVTAPKNGATVGQERVDDLSGDWSAAWLNMEQNIANAEQAMTQTAYLGEALPCLWASLGPGQFGTFLGAEPIFRPDTVWYEPISQPIVGFRPSLAQDGRWWKWSIHSTAMAVEKANGRYLVNIPDMVENLDTIAALFGAERILVALIDYPEEIHRIQKELLPLWLTAYEAHYQLVADQEGWSSFAAFNIWGKGRTAKLQCDLSAMLSKAMFDEFVIPYLIEQCRHLDNTIYHLDGPGAIHHLTSLLGIEDLDCIQWTPGAGKPPGGDPCWDDIYRRTLDAGKRIHATMPLSQVRGFVQRFGKDRVFIHTQAESVAAAEELLSDLTRL